MCVFGLFIRVFVVLAIAAEISFVGIVLYVAYHFISKVW